jgi:hypothetical protein
MVANFRGTILRWETFVRFLWAPLIVFAVLPTVVVATDRPSLDGAVALQNQGKLAEARDAFRAAEDVSEDCEA